MRFVMKKQLFWALVALGVSVGYLIHDERTSAQTQKPGALSRRDIKRAPVTATTRPIGKEPGAPAPPLSFSRTSTASRARRTTTASPTATSATPIIGSHASPAQPTAAAVQES